MSSSFSKPKWSWGWILLLASALLTAACSGDDRADFVADSGEIEGSSTERCEDGQARRCSFVVDQSSGVLSCWEGRQRCERGAWGACSEGELIERPDTSSQLRSSSVSPFSLSGAPVACNNVCDPSCFNWFEDGNLSGTVSGGLPNYPGRPVGTACAHDACTMGAALPSTCSSCVTQVCAVDSTCCSASWDSDCVDLAYSLCVGQPAPTGLCDYALYSTNLLRTAGPLTGDVSVGSLGNVDIGVGSQVRRILSTGNVTISNGSSPASPFVAPEGVFATGNVDVQAGTSRVGPIRAGGRVWLASNVQVMGDVWARTNLEGQLSSRVMSNAYAGGTIDANVAVVGTRTPGSTHAAPVVTVPTTIPTRTLACTGTGYYTADGTSGTVANRRVTLPPGNYDTVELQNGGVLELNGAGNYYFRTLSLNGSIRLIGTGARWDVSVCNTYTQGNNSRILDASGALLLDPTRFTLYVHGANVHMDTNVDFVGVLIAPNANFYKSPNGSIRGAIWARNINTIEPGTTIVGMTQEQCEAIGLPGTTPPAGACPIVNTTPATPPARSEPCVTGRDCQINSRCQQPRTNAACTHSKCMEGSALNASCDECVQRICAVDSTCCSGSWSASCVARVATVCDATCGRPTGCSHQACTTGSALDASCSSCAASVCATRPSCCTSAWDASCVDLTYELCGTPLVEDSPWGGSVCDYAVHAAGSVALTASVGQAQTQVLGGKVRAGGAVTVTLATVADDVFVGGSAAITTSLINGSLVVAGGSILTLVLSTLSTITEGIVGSLPAPTVTRPTRTFTCSGVNGTPSSGTIPPGNYGNVVVPAGSTLTLQPGTYSFQSLWLANESLTGATSTLALPSTGRVSINACTALGTSVYFGIGSKMTGLTPSRALQLDIYGLGEISAVNAGPLYGFFNSDRSVRLDLNSTLYGRAFSGNVVNALLSTIDARGQRKSCIENGYDTALTSYPSSPARLCAYSAWGTTDVNSVGNNAIQGGDVGARGPVVLGSTGGRTEVRGSVIASGIPASAGLATLTGSLVLGDVRVSGTLSGSPTTLGLTTSVSVPSPSFPAAPSFTCPTSGADRTGTQSITPGTYGNLTANSGQNITLSAGRYYFNSVRFVQNNSIILPTTGVVEIFSCNEVQLGPGVQQTNLVAGADSLRFRVTSLSSKSTDADPAILLNAGAAQTTRGLFIAPNGKIVMGANSRVHGLTWGRQVKMLAGAQINSTNTSGAACEAALVDTQPACPVTFAAPTPPPEGGQCLANAAGYTDTTCPGYDLALGIPCGSTIPVCNHGTVDFNGPVRVGYWPDSARVMSTPTPGTPSGSCQQTLAVPAGMCATLTCSSPLPAGLLTMMVDPAAALSECNQRRLDNWTVHDGQSCSGSGSLRHTFDYAAVCEQPGTAPRWGLLTWNGIVPGSSEIRFAARVGTSAGDAGTRSFTPLATATSTRPSCLGSGPLPCPIDLTEALGLGLNQGSHLDLQIELAPTSGNVPLLDDWRVTYSCVFDQ